MKYILVLMALIGLNANAVILTPPYVSVTEEGIIKVVELTDESIVHEFSIAMIEETPNFEYFHVWQNSLTIQAGSVSTSIAINDYAINYQDGQVVSRTVSANVTESKGNGAYARYYIGFYKGTSEATNKVPSQNDQLLTAEQKVKALRLLKSLLGIGELVANPPTPRVEINSSSSNSTQVTHYYHVDDL